MSLAAEHFREADMIDIPRLVSCHYKVHVLLDTLLLLSRLFLDPLLFLYRLFLDPTFFLTLLLLAGKSRLIRPRRRSARYLH